MTTLFAPETASVSIAAGDAIWLGSVDGGAATVKAGDGTWHLKPGESLSVGGFKVPITATVQVTAGRVRYTPGFSAQLDDLTDRVRSATIIAKATKMGLHDKMKALADKMHATPRAMSDMADRLSARIDTVQTRGAQAEAGMHAVLDDVEKGVAATEDALNQLTNGTAAS